MRYVLYLTDVGFTVYPEKLKESEVLQNFFWRDKTLIDEFIFQLSISDEVFIILDLIDEELNFEWSPKVLPWERSALMKRRLSRLMVDNVALAEVVGNQAQRVSKDGRKEELVLSANVNNTFNLQSFLAKLERANVLLKEIYSKPFLLKKFYEDQLSRSLDLSAKADKLPLLITSRQSKFRYRQTFIFEGHLRLSRLVELDDSLQAAEEIQDALLNETRMAISYIYNQKVLPFNSPFAMLFLDSDHEVLEGLSELAVTRQLIHDKWKEEEYFFVTTLFPQSLADSYYCGQSGANCYSEQAMVDYVFQDSPKGFYHTAYTKKLGNILLGRKFVVALNVVLFLGMVGYMIANSVDSYLKWQEIGMLEERITAHQTEKERLESLVKLKDDAQTIKSSVEFSESILKLKLGKLVGFDIQSLSETISQHPNVQISDIKWRNARRFDSQEYEIIFNAWVFPFYGTYKKPVELVDKFVADLAKTKNVVKANLMKEPLNRKLNEAMTIKTNTGDLKALPFSVTLRVKHGRS